MAKLTDLTSLTNIAGNDEFYVVDVSDTSESAQGTSKKITRDQFSLGVNHTSLASLLIDVHTQYPLLAGRSGGQTLIGGTGTTDDLILRATSGVGTTGSFIDLQTGNNGANITRIDDTGNVGIGQTTPSSKFSGYKNLSVNANNGSTLSLEAGGQPRFLFTADGTNSYISSYDDNPIIFNISTGNFANSTGTERMRIDANGNIGVNVTPSAWASIFRAIEGGDSNNQGAIAFRTDVNGVELYTNAIYDTTNDFKYKNTGTAGRIRLVDNTLDYQFAVSGNSGASITFTSCLGLELGKTLALQGATSQTGTGITFPASQSASTNANTLDDYEEGTWTILIEFNGSDLNMVKSANTGTYTKIGRMVFVTGLIVLTNKGTATGNAVISGLPFAVQNNDSAYSSFSIGELTNVTFADFPQGYFGKNTQQIILKETTNAGVLTNLTNADFANNSSILFSGAYVV